MLFTKKNKKNIYLLVVIIVLLSVGYWLWFKNASTGYEKKFMVINGDLYELMVADTTAKRTKGLSNTRPLLSNSGMVFVFDYEDLHGIWMKDMNYSIDVVWLDSLCRVTGAESMTKESYPEVFYPYEPAKYILELPFNSIVPNIEVGDELDCKGITE
jgi:uncharacterized membrane protein (UPF0127 family)